MSQSQRTESDRILAAREHYVARGITASPLVVGEAKGARIVDVDGRSFIDFAGGIGCAVLDAVADPVFLERAVRLGETLREALDDVAARQPAIGEVRGLGPMLALEFMDRAPERTAATIAAAYERGLLLLSCGLYGNVLRLLPPLTIDEDDLAEGLALLEESLDAAG
jgi:4-aminobutyrate aminotransferase-like enzyme